MKLPQIDVIPERGAVLRGKATKLSLLLRIQPPPAERVAERVPMNLSLVLDRSGSMSDGKLVLAQEAACNLVSNLRPTDRVSIVAFDTTVSCVVPSTLVTDVPSIHKAIRGIYTAGQTALHQGWVEGGLQVSGHQMEKGVNRIILLTDGQANQGECRVDALAAHAKGLAKRGVSTTTMGIGDDYEELLLGAMARSGDGNFYHIQSAAQFEEFFNLELQGLSNLYGRNVRLTCSPQAGVQVTVLNRLDRERAASAPSHNAVVQFFRKNALQERLILPNLLSDLPVEISFSLQIEAKRRDEQAPLISFELAWDNKEGEAHSADFELALPAVSDEHFERDYPSNPKVVELAVLMEIAGLKLEANEQIRARQFERAAVCLQKAKALATQAPQTQEMQLELVDLSYIQGFLDRGQYATVSKHAYYQSHQRSQSKTSFSSGRETRH